MRRFLCVAALLAASLFGTQARAAETKQEFVKRVYSSVVLLYAQDETGGMKMRCTATAYRRIDAKDGAKKTRFVSAAHCVEGNTDEEQARQKFFVTLDAEGAKTFLPAVLVKAGDKKKGDDFSIFEVEGDKIPVIPVGDDKPLAVGDQVVDVSSPFGLGKIYFEGYIGCLHIDRPPLDAGEVQWNDVMIAEIGGGPGSSGSSVVSVDQKAIIGFLVGSFNGNVGMIVVPVDKFKKFEAQVDAGTYKKTPPKEEASSFFGLREAEMTR